MIRYLFTNDLRISKLDESIVNASKLILTDSVPSASVDKSANNNINTLSFYFNLKKGRNCTDIGANGDTRAVVLNFIKKFQFPNPRTKESMENSIADHIIFAPMRIIVKLLYIGFINDGENAYLTSDEIREFVFFNTDVVTIEQPNLVKIYEQIKEYRINNVKPDSIVDDEQRDWKHSDRQLREMTQILNWAGCVSEDENGHFKIKHNNLNESEKADLFEILTYNEYWDYKHQDYFDYMDIVVDDVSATNLIVRTPEWFKQKAPLYSEEENRTIDLYDSFREKFGPDALMAVDGLDLLHLIFINETRDKENLCYTLEFNKNYEQFGGIGGGFSSKYGLYYDSKKGWVKGAKAVNEADAIEIGTSIRDELVKGAKIIQSHGEFLTVEEYLSLYDELKIVMPKTINKMWVLKYFHMLFPDVFPTFYNEKWQRKVLATIGETYDSTAFARIGKIALFIKKCGISSYVFSKIIYDEGVIDSMDSVDDMCDESCLYTFDTSKGGAQNRVVYGTPGCGKSYYVQNTYLDKIGVSEENRIRTTFYQDYTNTDFVGQILPKIVRAQNEGEKDEVTYEFNPGPFALALKMAIEYDDEPIALIIEELNRGNAASIFGDIFQLLDRDENGKSQYSITNTNLQDYLTKEFAEKGYIFNSISIPGNLYIVATMNTSDQNVFTLDTAFKRRWQFEKLRNKFTDDHEYKNYTIPGMDDITWEQLVTDINAFIVSRADDLASEDKQLGVYFIAKENLYAPGEDANEEKVKTFAYKLFEYLWDDVAKFSRVDWFGDIKTLDDLIDKYISEGKKVFVDGIIQQNN